MTPRTLAACAAWVVACVFLAPACASDSSLTEAASVGGDTGETPTAVVTTAPAVAAEGVVTPTAIAVAAKPTAAPTAEGPPTEEPTAVRPTAVVTTAGVTTATPAPTAAPPVAFQPTTPAPTAAPTAPITGSQTVLAANGAEVYTLNCARCHAENGLGTAQYGATLIGVGSQYSTPGMIAELTNGHPVTFGFADRLSADEIVSVVAYVKATFP